MGTFCEKCGWTETRCKCVVCGQLVCVDCAVPNLNLAAGAATVKYHGKAGRLCAYSDCSDRWVREEKDGGTY